MTDNMTPATVPEEGERLVEQVMDWVHAVTFIVVVPVVAGALLHAQAGELWGFGGFVAAALHGAWSVWRYHNRCCCNDIGEDTDA